MFQLPCNDNQPISHRSPSSRHELMIEPSTWATYRELKRDLPQFQSLSSGFGILIVCPPKPIPTPFLDPRARKMTTKTVVEAVVPKPSRHCYLRHPEGPILHSQAAMQISLCKYSNLSLLLKAPIQSLPKILANLFYPSSLAPISYN